MGKVDDVERLAFELGSNVERLALELRCNIDSWPTEYLGLPLVAKHKAARVWDGVEERFRRRLAF